MSAGTGIEHSEMNREDEDTTLFQIWILPDRRGESPRWDTKPFPKADRAGLLVTLASGMEGDDGALPINADARVIGATLRAGDSVTYETAPARHAYLVAALGRARIGEVQVGTRDGAAITGLDAITITAIEDSEIVLVDAA
jgi:redox-sensitive bicupin YhaK (pirin superfamily)